MQVETKKPCGACAAENAPDAVSCWRCAAGFGPAMPAGALPPPPWQAWEPQELEASTLSRRGRVLRAVVGLALGVAVAAGVASTLDQGPTLPDAVAGRSRVTSAEAATFQNEMQNEADAWDLHVQAGVYGVAGAPSLFVILVDGGAIETTDQLYQSFVTGMEGAGVRVDREAVVQGERDGTSYRCVPVEGQVRAVACMWRDEDNVGIVLGIGQTAQGGVDLLFAAHDAAVH